MKLTTLNGQNLGESYTRGRIVFDFFGDVLGFVLGSFWGFVFKAGWNTGRCALATLFGFYYFLHWAGCLNTTTGILSVNHLNIREEEIELSCQGQMMIMITIAVTFVGGTSLVWMYVP